MGTLSTEQIIQGIKLGRPITPFSADLQLIDKYVELISAQQMVLQTTAPELIQLFKHLKEPLGFISPERRKELLQCEIYVLPLPLCISYAHELDGKPIIVIANGLIDLIANTIFASYLNSMLPPELEEYYLFKFRKDMPYSDLFANAIFLLQLHFYRFCTPLPSIHALMTPDRLRQSRDAINGALLFILLHELGHHKLGHLENNSVRPMHYSMAIEEHLSIDQHQEMDADNFALESLVDQARIIGTYWQHNAINFFMQLELVSGQHSGGDHPMAINRAFYSDSLRSDLGKDYDITPREQFFNTTSERYLSTKKYVSEKANLLIETPQVNCLNILKEMNKTLADSKMDISPLWLTPSPHWLDTKVN